MNAVTRGRGWRSRARMVDTVIEKWQDVGREDAGGFRKTFFPTLDLP
jgi:hypothetical protein